MSGGGGTQTQRKNREVYCPGPRAPPPLSLPPLFKRLHKQAGSARFQRELHDTPFQPSTKDFYLKSCVSPVINHFTPH